LKYLYESYGKGGIYAKLVAASVPSRGDIPIYTIETKAPKFIDGQCEKHRMESKNSSSSRAIKTRNLIDQVLTDPFVPWDWRKNQKGMQGYEQVDDPEWCKEKWLFAKDEVCYRAEQLANLVEGKSYSGGEVHKQTVNRLLEPWAWQHKVWTATEWDNFFDLRLADDAQPEIQELARCMKECIDNADPVKLQPGEWHLPYALPDLSLEKALRSSVAGCARVSYGRAGGKEERTYKDDEELYDRLLKSRHLTPFEHQATPMNSFIDQCKNTASPPTWETGISHMDKLYRLWSGNFRYWIQYRKVLKESIYEN
jgi:thymidylate synthase ThyX